MEKCFRIEVAGICSELRFNQERYAQFFKTYCQNFVSEHEPQMSFDLTYNPMPKSGGLDPEANVEICHISTEGNLVEANDSFSHGVFDLESQKGKLAFSSMPSLRNFIRLCYGFVLMERNAFVLHSSGIIIGEKATLFSGPSNEGKSTIMRLSRLARLNEEANIVALEDGELMAYSTPFGGFAVTNNIKLPLERIYFIKKHKKTFTKALSKLDVFSELICNEFISLGLIFKKNPSTTNKLFQLLGRFGVVIPAKKLYFEKNENFLKLI